MDPAPTTDLPQLLRSLRLSTLERLLPTVEAQAAAAGWSISQALTVLCAEEVAHRRATQLEHDLHRAGLPQSMTLEDFEVSIAFGTSGWPELLAPYLDRTFVDKARNLIITGRPGRGKTALAVAIATRAIQQGCTARYLTLARLGELLSGSGRMIDPAPACRQQKVLIIDEIGYHPPLAKTTAALFAIVAARHHDRLPTILISNRDPADWDEILADGYLTEAILDRLLERGQILPLTGPSFRTRHRSDASQPLTPTSS